MKKIGGTVHLAIGMAYPESGGKNDSAVHWDMVCDLRQGGSITVDGDRAAARRQVRAQRATGSGTGSAARLREVKVLQAGLAPASVSLLFVYPQPEAVPLVAGGGLVVVAHRVPERRPQVPRGSLGHQQAEEVLQELLLCGGRGGGLVLRASPGSFGWVGVPTLASHTW